MKKTVKTLQHFIFWISVPIVIVYFNWANQNTSSLPGLPKPESSTFWDLLNGYSSSFGVLLLVAIPVFYLSLYVLTPRFLFKKSLVNYLKYLGCFALYTIAIFLLFDKLILRYTLYGFFGTPYEVKVLIPTILIFCLGGTLYAFIEKSRADKLDKLVLEKQNYELELNVLKLLLMR